jgi:diaminohydroxyphosphoribosylaminopyrimidine deaminase / 5-amino-6-(5-phosphoribosylamino)uracil reductase
MALTALDKIRMAQALDLAQGAIGVSEPNPRVGCVIGSETGLVLGQGATQEVGAPHAEVMALRQAQAQGHDLRGATAWVSLEPCAHHGRTPPCCDALISAGLGRVVVATEDPFVKVAGAGIARLRAAGIRVDMAGPEQAVAGREINIGFFSRIVRHRPWVRMKIAVTLDGRTALPDGRSQWITGPQARADGHAWRKRAGAVLTGLGTVVADNPRLDVRLVPTHVQPLRVVVDSNMRSPAQAAIFASPGRALVVGVALPPGRSQALQQAGAELAVLPSFEGRVDLHALVTELARREVNELHVEAGPRLNAALLLAGLVDELLVYQAPMLLGVGRGMADFGPWPNLESAPRFAYQEISRLGPDLRVMVRRLNSEPFGRLFEADPPHLP